MVNKKTRLFVTGCGGMLGQAVYSVFKSKYQVLATDIDLNEKWLKYADVRDLDKTSKMVNRYNPGLIIHLAALTDVEYCEKYPDKSWVSNALGTENMALIAQQRDVPLVYISTAGVFDGKKEIYTDFDQPNPINAYGRSKYYGELVVQRMLKRYFIFRASWMTGGGPNKDKKFINKIYKQIIAGKRELFVVNDKKGIPTYTYDFANNMHHVVRTEKHGLYNMACQGRASRFKVAKAFVKYLDLANKIKVTKVGPGYFNKEYFAPRPASEVLSNLKLSKRNLDLMRDWEKCLEEYTKEFRVDLPSSEEDKG